MNLDFIENCFCSFLDKFWKLNDTAPFSLTYIKLLLLFKNRLSQTELNVVLERKKQLCGEKFNGTGFDEIRVSSRKEIDKDLITNTNATEMAVIKRLLFCAMLDTEENDFFYLTEPMFEFVRTMKVSPERLKEILESEFSGFKLQ